MRNSLAHDQKDRNMAKHMWLHGVPRREIAEILDIPEGTVKSWRETLGWPKRTGNHGVVGKPRATKNDPIPATLWRCDACGGRCDSPNGHPHCRGAA